MKAIVRNLITAGALALTATVTGAQMALPRNLTLAKESKMWLEGTSTVRSFKCSATKLDMAVVAEPEEAPAEMVKTASLVVPVAQLECGNKTMNELKGTGSAENGTIRFKGSKQFKMTEYGVKPPSLMLGTMKVGDLITVSFDLVLSE